MKRGPFKNYKPRKGFYTAFTLMVATLAFLILGLATHKILSTAIALISGVIGLYFVKKSYVPYKSKKKKSKSR